MKILAIDPGTHCGMAWTSDGKVHHFFTTCLNLTPKRHEGSGMRFIRLENKLDEMKPDIIYYEEVRRHLGTDAAHIYGGLVAIITAWSEKNIGGKCVGVPVGTIKKMATGKGNASKEEMIAAAKRKYNYGGDDDNEADALHLLAYALTEVPS